MNKFWFPTMLLQMNKTWCKWLCGSSDGSPENNPLCCSICNNPLDMKNLVFGGSGGSTMALVISTVFGSSPKLLHAPTLSLCTGGWFTSWGGGGHWSLKSGFWRIFSSCLQSWSIASSTSRASLSWAILLKVLCGSGLYSVKGLPRLRILGIHHICMLKKNKNNQKCVKYRNKD